MQVHQAAVGGDKCCYVEARLLPKQAVANRARLQAEADAWLAELTTTPPGNAQENGLWQVRHFTVALAVFCVLGSCGRARNHQLQ